MTQQMVQKKLQTILQQNDADAEATDDTAADDAAETTEEAAE